MKGRMLPVRLALAKLCFLFGVGISLAGEAAPSFDCAAAHSPDEVTICKSAHLAELDRALFQGYELLKKHASPAQTKAIGIAILKLRRACGSDSICIQLAQLRGIATYQYLALPVNFPQWTTLEGLRESTVRDVGTGKDKLMVGMHGGDATIVGYSGIDTARASIKLRRDVDDYAEDCSRNLGLDGSDASDAMKISACVVAAMKDNGGHEWSVKADCSRNELWVFEGKAVTLTSIAVDEPATVETRESQRATTTWEGESGDGGDIYVILASFEALCPAKYHRLFYGLEPH